MVIVQEHFMVGETDFIRTYSDRSVMIHGGFPEADYDVAEDPVALDRTYTETNIPVENPDFTDSEILTILLGKGGDGR